MEGRFHQYEGYPLKQITLPVRVMKALGAEAADRLASRRRHEPDYRAGDVMIIDDQINLMGDNPLVGVNDDRLGPRFPDMSAPYDSELIEAGLEVARRENFVAHRGVTVAVTGPNLETRAEYRFLRRIGADVVGMSTDPRSDRRRPLRPPHFGLSVITDMCLPDTLEPVNVERNHRLRQRRRTQAASPGQRRPEIRSAAIELDHGAHGERRDVRVASKKLMLTEYPICRKLVRPFPRGAWEQSNAPPRQPNRRNRRLRPRPLERDAQGAASSSAPASATSAKRSKLDAAIDYADIPHFPHIHRHRPRGPPRLRHARRRAGRRLAGPLPSLRRLLRRTRHVPRPRC